MQKAIGLIVLGSGLGISIYANAPSSSEREAQVAAITRIVARATILEPETVAAEQPGLRRPVSSLAFGAAMPTEPTVQVAPATLPSRAATPAAAPASDADANTQQLLARAIQKELKRVGCYTGRLDGSWGEQSRGAMMAFITRVNASLPTTEPDVILLSLVKGHSGEVCGISCPPSQVASGGRCVARAVVAAAEPPADLSAVPPRATVAMADPETQPADTPRRAPPPGRMSIGGPTPDNAVPAPPVTGWPAPDGERLPWMKDPAAPPAVAAVAPEDLPEEDDVSPSRRPADAAAGGSSPPPRKYVKPRSRQQASKPNQKKRYATRSVQMLFLHPLGRM
jgi:hypothetical protein